MYSKKGMETICENFNVDHGDKVSTDQEKNTRQPLDWHHLGFQRNKDSCYRCVLRVIIFRVKKYKEYSLRFIIVLIIDITGNMRLLLHNNEI